MARKHVIIIGGGLGGLLSAIKLKEAGHNFTLLERSQGVGGTWHDNKYPGCSCDVPVSLYQFSFAPSLVWNKNYPDADEVEAYANELVETFQLSPGIRLGVGAQTAEWDEQAKVWNVTTSEGDVISSDALIGALGQLNKPKWPEIDGLGDFDGPIMHTARWDRTVSYKDKRVGVIGTGASAVQLVPPMAKEASHLTVFQRSPNYIVPRPDQAITAEDKALIMSDPDSAGKVGVLMRELTFTMAELQTWKAFAWTQEGRDVFTAMARNHMEASITDPDMRQKLTPDYPVGCRRVLTCDDYYQTLVRADVTLETTHIARMLPDGVELKNGERVQLDVIALATGFDTTDWRWSVDIKGADGQWLHETWSEVAKAYLGITVAGFPNFFMMYGPNTNLGHNSITLMMEAQIGYVIEALDALDEKQMTCLTPTQEAQDAFNAKLQADLKSTVWGDEACGASWYKTSEGYITQNWSGNVTSYTEAVSSLKHEDYEWA
ncbi:MAG: NAD(P)/FAD-dependent oxidoreductase [Hyphomonadaceae bacterium]